MERKPIGKKLRFEVFKRDSFTCQYCGRMAPDVILEVDHITPVAEGGSNDIVNLITSCRDCNRGKGKQLLNESDTIKKSQDELKKLEEKREQIEMMMDWKKELESFEDKQIEYFDELFSRRTKARLSNKGKALILKTIKTYSFKEAYESAIISIDTYYKEGDENSADKAIEYVPRICYNRKVQKDHPEIKEVNYLAKLASGQLQYFNRKAFMAIVKPNYRHEDFEEVKRICYSSRNWTILCNSLKAFFME